MKRIVYLLFIVICAASLPMELRPAFRGAYPAQQSGKMKSGNATFDPLRQLNISFPHSTKLKSNGRLLEFCPDNTCDGFVVAGTVSLTALKHFAYLYEYFFSDFIYLDEWRAKPEAKDIAQRVLSRTEYHNCANTNDREAARCILMGLSRNGRVKLIFVRYDEGTRGVVTMDITKELSDKRPAAKER